MAIRRLAYVICGAAAMAGRGQTPQNPQTVTTTCTVCVGRSSQTVYPGGDRAPLSFSSLVNPMGSNGTEAVFCYEQSVQNHSARDVPDVDWADAGIYKRLLPPTERPICDPIAAPGVLDYKLGRVNFGPGKNSYPGTAYQPKGGWSRTANLVPLRSDKNVGLTATVHVPFPRSEGQTEVVTIRLRSIVQRMSSGEFEYWYEAFSDKERRVRLFWNLPQTDELRRQYNPDEPPSLAASSPVKVVFRSRTAPAWGLTPDVVADNSNAVWGYNLVAVYGVQAGRQSTNKIYDRP